MSHTKEPWRHEFGKDGHEVWAPHGETGSMRIAACGFAATFDKENASRIVACVNACKRIDTPTLEAVASCGGISSEPINQINEIAKQRDELLAALDRLSFAAACRENTMGDQCRLVEVKAELSAANEQATAAIRLQTKRKQHHGINQ